MAEKDIDALERRIAYLEYAQPSDGFIILKFLVMTIVIPLMTWMALNELESRARLYARHPEWTSVQVQQQRAVERDEWWNHFSIFTYRPLADNTGVQ